MTKWGSALAVLCFTLSLAQAWKFWKRKPEEVLATASNGFATGGDSDDMVPCFDFVSFFSMATLGAATLLVFLSLLPPKQHALGVRMLREALASASLVVTQTLLEPTVSMLGVPGSIPRWLLGSLSHVVAMEVSAGAFGNPAYGLLFALTHGKDAQLVLAEACAHVLGATATYKALILMGCQNALPVDLRGPTFASDDRRDAFASEFATCALMSFAILAIRTRFPSAHLLKQALRAACLCVLFALFPSAGLSANPAISSAWELASRGTLPLRFGFLAVYILAPTLACAFVALVWGTAKGERRVAVPPRVQALKDDEVVATLANASPARRTRGVAVKRPPMKPRKPSKQSPKAS